MLFVYTDFESDPTDFLCPADEDFKIAGYAEDDEPQSPAYELSEILDPMEEYALEQEAEWGARWEAEWEAAFKEYLRLQLEPDDF